MSCFFYSRLFIYRVYLINTSQQMLVGISPNIDSQISRQRKVFFGARRRHMIHVIPTHRSMCSECDLSCSWSFDLHIFHCIRRYIYEGKAMPEIYPKVQPSQCKTCLANHNHVSNTAKQSILNIYSGSMKYFRQITPIEFSSGDLKTSWAYTNRQPVSLPAEASSAYLNIQFQK